MRIPSFRSIVQYIVYTCTGGIFYLFVRLRYLHFAVVFPLCKTMINIFLYGEYFSLAFKKIYLTKQRMKQSESERENEKTTTTHIHCLKNHQVNGEYDDCGENEYKYLSFYCNNNRKEKYRDKVAKLMYTIINDTEKQSVVASIFFVFWSQLKRIICLHVHTKCSVRNTIFRMVWSWFKISSKNKNISTHSSSDRINLALTYRHRHQKTKKKVPGKFILEKYKIFSICCRKTTWKISITCHGDVYWICCLFRA